MRRILLTFSLGAFGFVAIAGPCLCPTTPVPAQRCAAGDGRCCCPKPAQDRSLLAAPGRSGLAHFIPNAAESRFAPAAIRGDDTPLLLVSGPLPLSAAHRVLRL